MRCLAVCQNEIVIRMLNEALSGSYDLEFLVQSKTLGRKLRSAGFPISVGDPERTAFFLRADLTPGTAVIIEDNGQQRLIPIIDAAHDAGGTLIYVLGASGGPAAHKREQQIKKRFPDISYLTPGELFGSALAIEFSRSLTRLRVQQYRHYLADARRVLILLHNDPDPDAMASGLALRSVLRRMRSTAPIGAFRGVTRPENARMQQMLDIVVEPITSESLSNYDRVAMVDVQPAYFGGQVGHVDLVIDHHPEQSGYRSVFTDVRPNYGSTSTILTEHLRAVDEHISERTATAMLYAIKSDTLFFRRQTSRVDIEAFSYLYPLADATLVGKMEGADITPERLDLMVTARKHGRLDDGVFCAFLGAAPRDDLVPFVADFYLQLEDVRWTVIGAHVGHNITVSVRNLGYTRNAGEFMRQAFGGIGSAGGHRAMAKAVIPVSKYKATYGSIAAEDVTARLSDLMRHFLRNQPEKRIS
jgi:nanoRNase/pAp phosphatase (c-di-AMP/oligoRNAs hydrolase)